MRINENSVAVITKKETLAGSSIERPELRRPPKQPLLQVGVDRLKTGMESKEDEWSSAPNTGERPSAARVVPVLLPSSQLLVILQSHIDEVREALLLKSLMLVGFIALMVHLYFFWTAPSFAPGLYFTDLPIEQLFGVEQ